MITTKSQCACGQEFFIESGRGGTCRRDGKRVYPADEPDTGWDCFRCPKCGAVVSETVPGAEHDMPKMRISAHHEHDEERVLSRHMDGRGMSDIAKCPICGEEPEVWCRVEEVRSIVCCKHAAYSTIGWNQYAAAMELAKAIVKHESELANENDQSGDYAEIAARHVADMERCVLEVFK